MRTSWNVGNSPGSRREYHRVAGPLRDSVNSAILEDSISAAELLRRMVGLPCRHESMDVRFRIGAVGIPRVQVRHGIEIRVVR